MMRSRALRLVVVASVVAGCGTCGEGETESASETETETETETAPETAPATEPESGTAPEPEGTQRVDPSGTHVVVLGSGTPVPYPDRTGPALAVVVDGHAYLVDLGTNVVRRAAEAAERTGLAGLSPASLRTAFCTHLHSDHTLGYADLILTPWVVGRTEPLRVWGPPGIEAMTSKLLDAYAADIRVRTEGLESASPTGHRVKAREIAGPGLVHEDERVRVRAFEVDHGSFEHAYGYRFETDDRVVVVSGDTRPTDAVVRACDGCDVLVHEVYSEAGLETLPPSSQRYHRAFHTSATELAGIAKRANPDLLVLTHQLTWGAAPATILDPLTEQWTGELVWAEDLSVH